MNAATEAHKRNYPIWIVAGGLTPLGKPKQSVINRFLGSKGESNLIEALANHELLSGRVDASKAIYDNLELIELSIDETLISQGAQDNDLYFIISGSLRILVNNREIAVRRAGDHVGEMTLLDRTAVRSSSAIAAEPTVVAKISEEDFTRVADEHPALWRRLAITIAKRLRERNRFISMPHTIPTVFIGSSTESQGVADKLFAGLQRSKDVEPQMWTTDVFKPTLTTIENLLTVAVQADFAILVLSPDDVITSRRKKKPSPRDNVIFELGLFIGALKRDRTCIVAASGLDLKIPSDLYGVTLLTYDGKGQKFNARVLRPVIRKILQQIAEYGPK